jgi:fatty acid-binding protein DegV
VAGFGSLLQVKPLLRMYEGEPTSERVRTINGAFGRLENLLVERAPFERIALVHTHAGEQVELLMQRIEHLLPEGELTSVDITPVIGAHIGPGAVGFACISSKD